MAVSNCVICDDAEDVDISGLRAQGSLAAESLIRLRSTRDAFLHGCGLLGEAETFLRVEGRECRGITLIGNELRGARRTVETALDAEAGSVR